VGSEALKGKAVERGSHRRRREWWEQPPVTDLSCDFDSEDDVGRRNHGLCDWWQDVEKDQKWASSATSKWQWVNGKAPRQAAGDNKVYRVVDTHASCEDTCEAILHSSPLILAAPMRLEFQYNILHHSNSLVIRVNEKESFKATGDNKVVWKLGVVDLSSYTGQTANISIVGARINKGYVAIDEVKLLSATVPTPPPTPIPAPTPPASRMCWCTDTTYNKNKFRCTDGYEAHCSVNFQCFGFDPLEFGDWDKMCRYVPTRRRRFW